MISGLALTTTFRWSLRSLTVTLSSCGSMARCLRIFGTD